MAPVMAPQLHLHALLHGTLGWLTGEKSIWQPMGQTELHLGHMQGEEKSATCEEPGHSFSRLPQTINGT